MFAVAATSFLFCPALAVVFLFIRFLLQRRRWRRSASRLLLQQHLSKLGLDAAAIALSRRRPPALFGAGVGGTWVVTVERGVAETMQGRELARARRRGQPAGPVVYVDTYHRKIGRRFFYTQYNADVHNMHIHSSI